MASKATAPRPKNNVVVVVVVVAVTAIVVNAKVAKRWKPALKVKAMR